MNNNLLILGAGEHGHVVKEIAEIMRVFDKISFLDDNPSCKERIGPCRDFKKYASDYSYAFVAIGNNKLRMNLINKLQNNDFMIPLLIHPTAYVSPSASVNLGTVVQGKAIINTSSIIQKGCIISLGAIVDHDTVIGYGSHIQCGSIINANCKIKPFSTIESGKIITKDEMQNQDDIDGDQFSFEVGV